MQKKIKIVIFDLDGTLVDAFEPIVESFNYTMEKMGLPLIDEETIQRAVGWGERKLFERLIEEQHIDQVIKIYRQHHVSALPKKVKFLPGGRELLNDLKQQGYRLGVGSNRPTRTSMIILEALNVKSDFDSIICGDQIDSYKPDPGILLSTLERFSLSPQEALFVGDMAIDAQAGHQAGIKTVVIPTGTSTEDEIQEMKPYRLIQHLSEVSVVLKELEGADAPSKRK